MKIIKTTISSLLFLALANHAGGSDIDFAPAPLPTETEGVSPNILLVIDDSGSMACANGNCGDDIFYAPGYDPDLEYRCNSGVYELMPAPGETIRVYVSRQTSHEGTPFFQYNGQFYGWGPDGASQTGYAITENACFNPNENYRIRLQANECYDGSYCRSPGDAPVEIHDGNFLNWYFSATIAEWADNTHTGGYKNDYPGHGYWHETVASNFITEHIHFCHRRPNNQGALPWCENNNGSTGYVYPEKTVINGSHLNGNNKTWFPPLTNGHDSNNNQYPGADWDSGSHGVMDATHSHSHSGEDQSMAGMKPGVHYHQIRLSVAIDTAKRLAIRLENANVAVASFATEIGKNNGVYSSRWAGFYDSDNGGSTSLMHGFVELSDDPAKSMQTRNNRESLLKAIDKTGGRSGTPIARTMISAARYLYDGFHSEELVFDGSDRSINQVLNIEFGNSGAASNVPDYSAGTKNISEELWCQKNAMAVLTDGVPSVDTVYSNYIKNYVPSAVSDPPPSYQNESGMVRVAGALFDHDFLPDIKGNQNLESFMIAFGADEVINSPAFRQAGIAGGGGVDNFFPASDGGAVIQAFNEIVSRVMVGAASVTAVAVSTISEVQADNYAIQASYSTEYWTSNVKAFAMDQNAQFTNPDGSGASPTTAGITPVWDTLDVMSRMYILNDDDIDGDDVSGDYVTDGVKKREVYTWSGTEGMRFGAPGMTRPANAGSAFPVFDNLPEKIRNDLSVLAGSDARERYDLMMFLLGDISNERGYPSAASANKYRQRGIYLDLDGDGKIDDVTAGGLLGDIANSSPIYEKAPNRPWSGSNYGTTEKSYADFKEQQQSRQAMVYAGANDGFLHAITIENGNRNGVNYPAGAPQFSYMPSMLASTLPGRGFNYLASQNYQHQFYVDMTPTISDVFIDFYNESGDLDPEWRTVLVGGLRSGGRGLFALDITCPYQTALTDSTCDDEEFSEDNVLWEFSAEDDADLGYTFAVPVIAKVNYDADYAEDEERNGNGEGRWAAIVSNGYNSTNGRAVLFVLFLDGGLDGSWELGKDYLKLYASDDSADHSGDKNGLSTATAVDLNGNGMIDRVYAGDLKGQMWAFDIGTPLAFSGD